MMAKTVTDPRRLMNILGIVIVFIALIFVFEKIWVNRFWILGQMTKQMTIILVFGSIVYALSCFLLSGAWQRLLVWFGQTDASIKDCHAVYGRTQIAKYIPGNIFHIAGRHVWGRKAGFGHIPLAGAAAYEILGLILASSTIALLYIVFWGSINGQISTLRIAAFFFVTLLIPLILNKIISSFPKLKDFRLQEKRPIEIVKGLMPVYSLYLLYFVIIGGILVGVVHNVSQIESISKAGAIISIFAVSWIAGFITPGSPGGFGVREAIIILFLSSFIGEPASLFVALIFRLITVTGDFLFLLGSYLIRLKLCHV